MALLSIPNLLVTEPVPEQFFNPEPEPIVEEIKEESIEISAKALCNCYKFVQESTGHKLPRMADIKENTLYPTVGDIAIMDYNGLKHVAVVIQVNGEMVTISESNYKKCEHTIREIGLDYRRLVGFYQL